MNTYNVKSLGAALTALKPILDSNKKNTLPVLDCIHLTGDAMTATDLETSVMTRIDGQGDDVMLIPAQKLSEVLECLDSETITLACQDRASRKDTIVTLTSDMSTPSRERVFTMSLFPPPVTDFPNMPDVANTERSAFAFEALREAAKWNIIGKDPYFASWQQYVHVRPTSTGMQVIRTNGSELVTFRVDGAFSFEPFCIAPHAVKLARHFIQTGEVACVENGVRFHSEQATVFARNRLHDEYSNNALKEDDIQRIFDAPEVASYVFAPRTKHDKRIALALQRGEGGEEKAVRLAVTAEGLSVVTDAAQNGLTFDVVGALLDRLLKFDRVVFRYGWKSEKAPGDHYGYLQGETVNEEGVAINYRCVVRLQNYKPIEKPLTAPVNAPIVEHVDEPTQEQEPVKEKHAVNVFEAMKKPEIKKRQLARKLNTLNAPQLDAATLTPAAECQYLTPAAASAVLQFMTAAPLKNEMGILSVVTTGNVHALSLQQVLLDQTVPTPEISFLQSEAGLIPYKMRGARVEKKQLIFYEDQGGCVVEQGILRVSDRFAHAGFVEYINHLICAMASNFLPGYTNPADSRV